MKEQFVRSFACWAFASVAMFVWPALLAGQTPYPPSPVVASIAWELKSHIRHGPGADQWPLCWTDDDNLYAAWGDGWGWEKHGPKYSIGVTRIAGNPPDLRGEDLWGAGPGSGFGKPEALIALDRKIYMFWTVGRSKDDAANTGTAVSSDYGVTWTLEKKKAFPQVPDGFRVRGIAQFGKGYEGAMDDFVYIYFGFSRANDIYLARVPKAAMLDAQQYEWFAGTTDGKPIWHRQFDQKKPAFTDPNGYIWHVGVTFVPGLGRLLLSKPHYARGGNRTATEGDRSKVAGLSAAKRAGDPSSCLVCGGCRPVRFMLDCKELLRTVTNRVEEKSDHE